MHKYGVSSDTWPGGLAPACHPSVAFSQQVECELPCHALMLVQHRGSREDFLPQCELRHVMLLPMDHYSSFASGGWRSRGFWLVPVIVLNAAQALKRPGYLRERGAWLRDLQRNRMVLETVETNSRGRGTVVAVGAPAPIG